MRERVLITGASGYIASHVCVLLLQRGYDVVGIDNLSNSRKEVLDAIVRIAGRTMTFIEADVRDGAALARLFGSHDFAAVLHFAGLKAVGDSVSTPLKYYDNNVRGSLELLQAMSLASVKRMIFSSSATVYGQPESVPIEESAAVGATNPYGRSKLIVEEMLADVARTDPAWQFGILRYFNPVGAHESALIGERPSGTPNNLMPYIAEVAIGLRPHLSVFGTDYPTPDGTGVRDYIHVMDLAEGHVLALEHLLGGQPGFTVNLGTGQGHSVFEVVKEFERASGRSVPYQVAGRRPGDVAECYADPRAARRLLNWQATRGLDQMCADHWRWQVRQGRQ